MKLQVSGRLRGAFAASLEGRRSVLDGCRRGARRRPDGPWTYALSHSLAAT